MKKKQDQNGKLTPLLNLQATGMMATVCTASHATALSPIELVTIQ